MKILLLYLFFIYPIKCNLCNTNCTWNCQIPETPCNAICVPFCQKPICEFKCHGEGSCLLPPQCSTICDDQCELDECPLCEIICTPNSFTKYRCFNCDPVCEAPVCNWNCMTPVDCEKPVCEITCENPSCNCVGDCSIGNISFQPHLIFFGLEIYFFICILKNL